MGKEKTMHPIPAIKIVKTPRGYARAAYLEEWVGLTLPLATESQLKEIPVSINDISYHEIENGGYIVLLSEAMRAIACARTRQTLLFWQKVRRRNRANYIVFNKEACQPIP